MEDSRRSSGRHAVRRHHAPHAAAYYDSVRLGRTIEDDQLIELLQAPICRAPGIEDKYQHDLYRAAGNRTVAGVLSPCANVHRCPKCCTPKNGSKCRSGRPKSSGASIGSIKLSNGRVVITDYKTGRPKSQEDADREPATFHLRSGRAREVGLSRRSDRLLQPGRKQFGGHSPQRKCNCRSANTKVEEVARKIAAEEFDAKPGFYCGFCAYRSPLSGYGKTPLRNFRGQKGQPAETSAQKLRGRFSRPPCFTWLKAFSVSSLRPSLLSSWLPLIYSPFPFFMDLKCNDRLLQLIDV